MSLPKISIVTITYNHENYIVDTLKGFIIQEYDGPIQIIIANDNSPDRTHQIITNFLSSTKIPSNFEINYTNHSINKGVMPNFIWALGQANGKYIALCEGDDYWIDPLKLQKQVEFLEKNEFQFCYTDYKIKKEVKKEVSNSIFKYDSSRHPIDSIDFLTRKLYLAPCSWLFSRELLDYIDFSITTSDGTYVMGYTFIKENKYGFLNEATCVYRSLEESASHSKSIFKTMSFHEGLYKTQLLIIKKDNLNIDLKNEFEKKFYINVSNILLDNINSDEVEKVLTYMQNNYDSSLFFKILLSESNNKLLRIKASKTYKFSFYIYSKVVKIKRIISKLC